ncbi:GAF domain-containing protein [Ideonella sp. BN130291]|nr:GAF domain-containing protein [Ideonella sp. BN130291]
MPPQGATLDEILLNHELDSRFNGRPRYPDEADLLLEMVQNIAPQPQAALQRLVESVLSATQADGAGVSLLDEEGGQTVFRWVATAGEARPLLGQTMPRHGSPCGEVLARNGVLLMREPGRHYASVQVLGQPLQEVLLAPIHRDAEPVGTLWVLSSTGHHRFDAEDARLLQSLAALASETGDLFERLSFGNSSYLS